jgi:hypothetical protein
MPLLGVEVGHPLSVHVGVANGQVVASREADTVCNFATVGERTALRRDGA